MTKRISITAQANMILTWYDAGDIDHNQACAILDILERGMSETEREHHKIYIERVRRLIESDMA